MSSAGRREGGKVAMAVGAQKGNTGEGGDQTGALVEGSGDVWPRPEEVSYATPSCEKVTLGLRQPPGPQATGNADRCTYTSPHGQPPIQTITHSHTNIQ